MADYATWQVRSATKKRLAAMRRPGETFDQVLARVLADAKRLEEHEFHRELDALFQDDDAFEPLR